jgi:hypothetical protein
VPFQAGVSLDFDAFCKLMLAEYSTTARQRQRLLQLRSSAYNFLAMSFPLLIRTYGVPGRVMYEPETVTGGRSWLFGNRYTIRNQVLQFESLHDDMDRARAIAVARALAADLAQAMQSAGH